MLSPLRGNVFLRFCIILLSIVLTLWLVPSHTANAQTTATANGAAPPDATGFGTASLKSLDIGSDLKRVAVKIKTAFDQLKANGLAVSKGAGVQGLAKLFFVTFGTIALVFPAIRIALGGGEAAMEAFLMALLTVGVFFAFSVGGSYETLANALSGMMSDLAQSILGSNTVIDDMGNLLKSVVDGYRQNLPTTIGQIWADFSLFVMFVLVGLFAIVVMIIAFFFVIIYINIGNVLMAIALAIGPIFIACGVWSVTRTFFTKWLHFLLVAGMYDVVAKLILALILKAGLLTIVGSGDVVAAVASMFFAVFSMATLAYISSLIPDIANALLPGSIGGMSSAGKQATSLAKKLLF